MFQIVEQRKYIQDFCDFVSSFGITESFNLNELELVEGNTKILLERIQSLKEKITIPASIQNCVTE